MIISATTTVYTFIVYSKLILFIEQEEKKGDHHEPDEKIEKKERSTHTDMSLQTIYIKAREHYRCVVVTDYRVGRQEQTQCLSVFVRSPSWWFRFFMAPVKKNIEKRRKEEKTKKGRREREGNS